MKDAYIVTSVRTPGCKRIKGAFSETRPEDLISFILDAAVKKTPALKKKEVSRHHDWLRFSRSRTGHEYWPYSGPDGRISG